MNRLGLIQRCVLYVVIRVVNNVADEKIFYLIGGPNGSGKTTLARQIVKTNNVEVLDLDNIALARNVSNITAARQLLCYDLPRVLNMGHSFVLESTLSGTFDARIVKMARDLKYKVILVFAFLASVEQNIERVAQRVKLGGHDVDELVIRRRYNKSLYNFRKIAPLVDKWMLFYNGESGRSYHIASGTSFGVHIENNEYYTLFRNRCLDATTNHLARLAQRGASEAILMAEHAGVVASSVALEHVIGSNQK